MIHIQQLFKIYPSLERKIISLYYNQVNFIYQNYESDQREKIIFNRLDGLTHKLSQVEKTK